MAMKYDHEVSLLLAKMSVEKHAVVNATLRRLATAAHVRMCKLKPDGK